METDLRHGRAAPTDIDIHPLIEHRWSPRAFSSGPVEPEKLRLLLEAARWAPSSYNEQPWRFLVATREEPEWLERLQGYLTEGNAWAKRAPVLIASALPDPFLSQRQGERDGEARSGRGGGEHVPAGLCRRPHHAPDGGIRSGAPHGELLPDGFEPGAMTAVGYPGDPEELAEKLTEREQAERERKDPGEFVFGPEWGKPAGFLG